MILSDFWDSVPIGQFFCSKLGTNVLFSIDKSERRGYHRIVINETTTDTGKGGCAMKQLAQEYRQSAQLLKRRRKELKQQLKEGQMGILGMTQREENRLKERIQLLELEYWDTLQVSEYLEHYYDRTCPNRF